MKTKPNWTEPNLYLYISTMPILLHYIPKNIPIATPHLTLERNPNPFYALSLSLSNLYNSQQCRTPPYHLRSSLHLTISSSHSHSQQLFSYFHYDNLACPPISVVAASSLTTASSPTTTANLHCESRCDTFALPKLSRKPPLQFSIADLHLFCSALHPLVVDSLAVLFSLLFVI